MGGKNGEVVVGVVVRMCQVVMRRTEWFVRRPTPRYRWRL